MKTNVTDKNFTTPDITTMTQTDLEQLVENLRVHQIELEMQNEELRSKQMQYEIAYQKYLNLFNKTPIGYVLLDHHAVIQKHNTKATDIFDYKHAHFVNKPFVSLLRGEAISTFFEYFDYAKTQKIEQVFDIKIIKNNQHTYIEVVISVHDEQSFLLSITDITTRKKAEIRIQESEIKYRTLFECANDVIFIADAQTGIITDANRKAETLLKRPLNQIIGMHQTQLHPSDKAQHYAKLFSQTQEHDVFYFTDLEVVASDNSVISVEISSAYIQINNKMYVVGIFHDISERKKQENALIKSEEQYRLLFESAVDAIIVSDPKGNVIDANPAALALYGFESKEIILQQNTSGYYIDSNDRTKLLTGLSENGMVKNLPITYRTFDNRMIHTEVSSKLLVLQNQTPLIMNWVHDVTDIKAAQQQLADSENRFRSFFEHSATGLVMVDVSGRFVKINPQFCNMLQYTEAELLGKHFKEITHPDDITNDVALVIQLLNNQIQSFNIKKRYVTKNNQTVWGNITVSSIKNDNTIQYLIGNIVDITNEVETQQLLLQSEEQYRLLFENMNAGFLLNQVIFDENQLPIDFCFIEGNKKIKEYVGFTIDELRNKLASDIFPSAKLSLINQHCNNALKGNPTEIEYYSEYFNRHFRTHLYSPQPSKLAMVIYDITLQKQAEQQLQQYTDELKQLNASKDKFFGIIAHDLKSPFNAILGFSELLLTNVRNYDIDKIEKQVHYIYDSAQRASNLLSDLLVWARSQMDKIPFRPQAINIHTICADVIEQQSSSAEQKNITINNQIHESVYALADSDMIKTIVRNLLSNAIKFTHSKGSISIFSEVQNNKIVIGVADNGVGMEPEQITNLFNITEKYTTQGTNNEEGTGLGLILCKEFAERNGGTIWVESHVGKGSVFYFSLPVAK